MTPSMHAMHARILDNLQKDVERLAAAAIRSGTPEALLAFEMACRIAEKAVARLGELAKAANP